MGPGRAAIKQVLATPPSTKQQIHKDGMLCNITLTSRDKMEKGTCGHGHAGHFHDMDLVYSMEHDNC
ncbi:hypothetical protein LEMLEM_LOCUS24481 [Lemmus lemmus]